MRNIIRTQKSQTLDLATHFPQLSNNLLERLDLLKSTGNNWAVKPTLLWLQEAADQPITSSSVQPTVSLKQMLCLSHFVLDPGSGWPSPLQKFGGYSGSAQPLTAALGTHAWLSSQAAISHG